MASFVALACLLVPAEFAKSITLVVPRVGEPGVDLQRPVEARDRLILTAEVFERVTLIVPRVDVTRVDLQRPVIARDRLILTAEVVEKVALAVPRAIIEWIDLKGPIVALELGFEVFEFTVALGKLIPIIRRVTSMRSFLKNPQEIFQPILLLGLLNLGFEDPQAGIGTGSRLGDGGLKVFAEGGGPGLFEELQEDFGPVPDSKEIRLMRGKWCEATLQPLPFGKMFGVSLDGLVTTQRRPWTFLSLT